MWRGMSEDLADVLATLAARAELEVQVESGNDGEEGIHARSVMAIFDLSDRLLAGADKVGQRLLGQAAARARVADDDTELFRSADQLGHGATFPDAYALKDIIS